MKTCAFEIRFTTPAFLGDASQNGRWRTPPLKAQLRQWWRMAWAADHGFRTHLAEMRAEEGRLFGVASDGEGDSRKSLIRIRLDKWDEGSLKKAQWPRFETIRHPEVPKPVASDLYLGYGPVSLPKGGAPTLKANAAIQAGEKAMLSIAVPEAHAAHLGRALWLMDRYGTLGGRSRNGWGSYALRPLPPGEGRGEGTMLAGQIPLRPWQESLGLDWPHAIGQDEKGALIWETPPHGDWKALMKTLAVLKIGLRTQFNFRSGKGATQPESRHWLSYPVTNHSVRDWGNNRLPNQLRFKVRTNTEGGLAGVIFHVPHLPPPDFRPRQPEIVQAWKQVHSFLDAKAQQLVRIGE